MRQKLNLITLGVKDVSLAARFWEALGWKRSDRSKGDMVLFPLGGMVLGLYPLSELAEDAGLEVREHGFSGISLSFNAVTETEVDAILEMVEVNGGTIVKPGEKVFWGGYRGYFKDPDGYLFEVAYNPFWPLNANGDLDL